MLRCSQHQAQSASQSALVVQHLLLKEMTAATLPSGQPLLQSAAAAVGSQMLVLPWPQAGLVAVAAELVIPVQLLSLLERALLRRVFLVVLEKPMWLVLRLLAEAAGLVLLVVKRELLALAVMAATVFSHPSMERPRITLAAVVEAVGLRTGRPMLLVGWAAAATPTALVAQQTQVAVVVVAGVKRVEPAQAVRASSSSVTHSVWHKDFK